MTHLHFAQLSDIHISVQGDHHDMLSGRSADFLADIIARLNQLDDLDFVLITGDLLDKADRWELERFQQVIHSLQKPYYVIPGNHDRRERHGQAGEGLTRRDFAEIFNPQFEARPQDPNMQAGYWSIEITPEVQLIGLDSIKSADWGGIIDATQMIWLEQELSQLTDKLVMVAVHHPLHILAPIDTDPNWRNFVCDNGTDVITLLDHHPQVKVVLTGHHHLTKVDKLGQRLHFACPAIAIYPCAYRTFQLTRQADGWQIAWQTHPATDETTVSKALDIMTKMWQSVGFEENFVQHHAALALGNEQDRKGSATL